MVRWIRIVAGPARASFSTTTYGAGRPKRGRFSSKDLPDGDAWRVVRTDMLGEGGVYVQTRVDLKAPGAADVVMKPTHGAAFHVSHLPRDTAPLSPHLGLWFDIRATKAPDIERVKTALVEIVDGIVRAGHAHQAFLARWDWRPALTLDATPYELACGVHGQCTTRHSWVERYLHAVADVVWLGPTLRERLPGFQAPEGTSAMAIGSALRVTCGDAGAVRAFERAVAPLLPGADDWKNALMGSR
jgi:hypothetical protein